MTENLTWQNFQPWEELGSRSGQRPVIAWLTGLPDAGKTSIANVADRALSAGGRHTTVLDGDNLRHGRIASPELLPAVGALHHLICSRRGFGGGGGDEAGEHGDAR